VTGKAKEKALALSVAIGSGYSYETTFEKEVYSDLYGERGVVSIHLFCYCILKLMNPILAAHGWNP
jgi:ketol-acid reductoisomerase